MNTEQAQANKVDEEEAMDDEDGDVDEEGRKETDDDKNNEFDVEKDVRDKLNFVTKKFENCIIKIRNRKICQRVLKFQISEKNI